MSEEDLEDIEKELAEVPSSLKPNSNQPELDFDMFEEENQEDASKKDSSLDKKQIIKDSMPSVKEFTKNIKNKIALAKKSQKEELDETAGLDLSAPKKPLFSRGGSLETAQEKTLFEQAMRPLSSSEITLLKAEVAADETIFSTISFNYRSAKVRQQIGFMLALILVVGFYAAEGATYLTNTLLDLPVPSWTPVEIYGFEFLTGEQVQTILFIIGALLPLAAIFIISESVRNLISGIVDFRSIKPRLAVQAILMGVVGVALTFACFLALWDREVLTALTYTLVYFIASFINDQTRA